MIQLNTPKTISQWGKDREIREVNIKAIRILNDIKKVLCDVENLTFNKSEPQYAVTLTLWSGVKNEDALMPDPKEGSYFTNKVLTDKAIEAKIKELLK